MSQESTNYEIRDNFDLFIETYSRVQLIKLSYPIFLNGLAGDEKETRDKIGVTQSATLEYTYPYEDDRTSAATKTYAFEDSSTELTTAEGVYTVDTDDNVTFTPVDDYNGTKLPFVGTATKVTIITSAEITDDNGNTVTVSAEGYYTPTVYGEGDVLVHYVNTDGETIKADDEDTALTEFESWDIAYDTSEYRETNQTIPATITEEDGTSYESVYRYLEIDSDGDDETGTITEGDSYDTTDRIQDKIVVDGVTYIRVPALTKGEETGTVTDGTTEVTYVYKALTTTWVTTDGTVLKDTTKGTFPDNDGVSDITGYKYVRTDIDEEGNVTNVYTLITNWVDKDGNSIKASEDGTFLDDEGDDIPGYELVRIDIDEYGNVTNVYRKVVTPNEPTPDKPSKPSKPKRPCPEKPEAPKPAPETPVTPTYTEETLPNTGDASSAVAVLSGLTSLVSGLGLAGRRNRRKK